MQAKIMEFYDAVIADNGMEVQKILRDDLFAQTQIPIKMITGMLVIAIENRLINAGQAILTHNNHTGTKIADKHLSAIMCLAAKSQLLDQFRVTYH